MHDLWPPLTGVVFTIVSFLFVIYADSSMTVGLVGAVWMCWFSGHIWTLVFTAQHGYVHIRTCSSGDESEVQLGADFRNIGFAGSSMSHLHVVSVSHVGILAIGIV